MTSRIQHALVRQIQRQIAINKRRDNEMFHATLRHKIQQRKLVEVHFEAREYDALQKFDLYYQRIKESMEINKTRFDLCLDERIDKIFADNHHPVSLYAFDHNEFDHTNKRMFETENGGLFFRNLYSPNGGGGDDSDNSGFYVVVFLFDILLVEIMKMF
jgi:hypothetical protein